MGVPSSQVCISARILKSSLPFKREREREREPLRALWLDLMDLIDLETPKYSARFQWIAQPPSPGELLEELVDAPRQFKTPQKLRQKRQNVT